MKQWFREIWQAWRASVRRPGFLLLATGVLALGVASSTSVFVLIDQVLLRPLPVPQPSRLMVAGRHFNGHVSAVSPQQYQHMQALDGVTSMGLIQDGPKVNIAGGGTPELIPAMYADRGLLPTVGLPMQLGRNFTAQEDRPGGPAVVMLAYGFWQRRYGGDSSVIGQSMQVEGKPTTIIGVLPRKFAALGFEGDIVLPTALTAASRNDGTNYMALVRLDKASAAPAVAAQVQSRLHAMYVELGVSQDNFWMHAHFGVQPFSDWQHHGASRVLRMFLASALFVLLIALVNLTNLMLLRALARNHDAAVRSALGASAWRLGVPALAEGLLVGLCGGALGLALSMLGLRALQSRVPADWLPGTQLHFGVGMGVLALSLGIVGAMVATAIGLWRSRVSGGMDELREGGRSGPGRRSGRLGRVLVVAQVALATALLSSAGLFLHTLYQASQTALGFNTKGILTFELAPVSASYADTAAVNALSERLLDRLRALPGVDQVTVTTNLPADLWSGQFNMGMHRPGEPMFSAQYHGVGAGFFSLFGIPLQQGRAFARGDIHGSEPVAIVSRSLARTRFGGHALGQQIQLPDGLDAPPARIVGIAGDTHQFGPLEPPPEVLYVPLAQMPDKLLNVFRSFEPIRFVLHGQGDPQTWRDAVKRAVGDVAAAQPISNFRSMRQIVHSTTSRMRLNLLLAGLFSVLALLLAAAGMYAVMAVAVAAREREFGVRTALGASPLRLTGLVLRGGIVQIVAGLALGVLLAWSMSGVMRAVMQQIGSEQAVDPAAIAGVCLLLAVAGMLACLLPALRAARVQPMLALRGE